MRKIIEFSVPVPCHENWNNMTPNEQGRFCSSCQKSVVDFTTMTDQELIRYFRNKKQQTCGRFRDDQLCRPMTVDSKKRIHWFKYFLQLLFPTLLVVNKSIAQGNVKTIKMNNTSKSSSECLRTVPITLGKALPATISPAEIKSEKKVLPILHTVSGRVLDRYGNVIEGASVMLAGTNIGISAGEDGMFSLPVKKEFPFTLMATYVGYEPVNIVITEEMANAPVEITLSESKVLSEVVVMGYGTRTGRATMGALCMFSTTLTSGKKVDEAVEKKVEVKLYPNPVRMSSGLTVEYPSVKNGKYTIEIFDISGKLLQMEQMTSASPTTQKHIQLKQSVVAGTYVVQVVDPIGKKIASEKIVVVD